MTDRGILFSAPMVRALIDGRKTQTRRLLSLRGHKRFSEFGPSDTPGYDWHFRRADACWCDYRADELPLSHAVGDRLWVRETWADVNTCEGPGIGYRTDSGFYQPEFDGPDYGAGPSYDYDKYPGLYSMWFDDLVAGSPDHKWRPSIFMPRWASRLTLIVENVRVERLQDISEADAMAEGVASAEEYQALWNTLHTAADTRWDDNPWVTATTFRVIHQNIDRIGE